MEQYVQTAPANTESNLFELQVDHEVTSHLRETAKWAKFLSIVGFVFIGILLVFVVIMGSVSYSYSLSPLAAAIPSGGFMQIVLLFAMVALYFFPCLFMFQFANKMLRALRNNDQYTLVASFRQLKLCYKYVGILTLIILSIYVLIIVGAILMALTR
jgi:hypothetical protein